MPVASNAPTLVLLALTTLSLVACSDDGESTGIGQPAGAPGTTASMAGVLCDYADTTFNATPSVNADSVSAWSCTDSVRELAANGIPDHDVGTFSNPGNRNTITASAVSMVYSLSPVETGTPTALGGPRGAVGYVLNGIADDADSAIVAMQGSYLDACNGRSGATPEFPDGIHHYFATDSYPYLQRCVTGEVEAGEGPGGPPPEAG